MKRSAMANRSVPMAQIGKVGKARQNDRTHKLRDEPARHDGRRQCYICLFWFAHVVLEHVFDASVYPEFRHNKTNHRWADSSCNDRKKRGTLTDIEVARVQLAMRQVQA